MHCVRVQLRHLDAARYFSYRDPKHKDNFTETDISKFLGQSEWYM